MCCAKLTHFPIIPKLFFNYFHFNQPNKSITDKPSRRDDTLLTVGFNLRIGDAACHVSTKSRRDKMMVEINRNQSESRRPGRNVGRNRNHTAYRRPCGTW